MYKILLLQNKDNVITLIIAGVLATLVLINVAVIAPSLQSVFSHPETQQRRNPIDIDSVNQAVQLLTE